MTNNNKQFLSGIKNIILEKGESKKKLSRILDEMLVHFECDRAWCLYPCDPTTEYWRVPIERTRYEWPGAKELNTDIPVSEDEIAAFNILLDTKGPVTLGPNADYPAPKTNKDVFRVQSQIATVIYPASGKPWILGIHYCENEHRFREDEINLFDQLGKQVAQLGDVKFD